MSDFSLNSRKENEKGKGHKKPNSSDFSLKALLNGFKEKRASKESKPLPQIPAPAANLNVLASFSGLSITDPTSNPSNASPYPQKNVPFVGGFHPAIFVNNVNNDNGMNSTINTYYPSAQVASSSYMYNNAVGRPPNVPLSNQDQVIPWPMPMPAVPAPYPYSINGDGSRPGMGVAPALPFRHQPQPPPQSLTMQMAIRPELQEVTPKINRPHASDAKRPLKIPNAHLEVLSLPSSSNKLGSVSAPVLSKVKPKPNRPRRKSTDQSTVISISSDSASSEFESETSSGSGKLGKARKARKGSKEKDKDKVKLQCSATTRHGVGDRCKNSAQPVPGYVPSDSEVMELYCKVHEKMFRQSGFFSKKNREFISFEHWIPLSLQQSTQVALRIEMDKPPTNADEDGYIYIYEIREGPETDTIKLKVGRSVNLVKRLAEWDKQCGSANREHILRGFFPSGEDKDGSMMKGRVKVGPKGPYCHRLEKLIHLELSDLSCSKVYLEPNWTPTNYNASAPTSGNQAVTKTISSKKRVLSKCLYCTKEHREIFEFERWKTGPHVGKEWDVLVKDVVERWGMFVELYV